MKNGFAVAWMIAAVALCSTAVAEPIGSSEKPLRVMLVPADGGTEDGTRADFLPIFNALTRLTGLHFDVRTGQSYAAVIEGMCNNLADIAWFGSASYIEARDRGCAELLAVDMTADSSVYYSGIFVRANSSLEMMADLQGHSLALGSPHSTSSFIYPVAMLLTEGVDPAADLGAIRITGSHANSLLALNAGLVDAAAASLVSYARAVNNDAIDPDALVVLARSEPIPNPPLALHPTLDDTIKTALRDALANVHTAEGISPEMVRGYGGKRVDRYDTQVTDQIFEKAVEQMALVNDDVLASILLAAGRQ